MAYIIITVDSFYHTFLQTIIMIALSIELNISKCSKYCWGKRQMLAWFLGTCSSCCSRCRCSYSSVGFLVAQSKFMFRLCRCHVPICIGRRVLECLGSRCIQALEAVFLAESPEQEVRWLIDWADPAGKDNWVSSFFSSVSTFFVPKEADLHSFHS
jgi:hypothetical protein